MPKLSGRTGLLALSAFLVVDVVLVGLAVSSTRQPVAGGGTQLPSLGTSATTTPGASSSPSKSPSSSSSGTSTPAAVKVVPTTVGLVAVTSSTALRFSMGTCADGGSALALTRDGGGSWTQRPAPFDTTIRLRVRGDGSAFAIGAASGGECATQIRQADAFDGDFGDAQSVADAWFRDPRRATTVGLPSGKTSRPCGSGDVVDLAVADSGAAVLCEDGRVLSSATGNAWDRSGTVPSALAVARGSAGRVLVAATGVGDCDGIAVVDAAKPTAVLGCAAVKPSSVTPGSVALSVTSDSGWLVVGADTYRSDGTLSSWKKQ